MSRCLLSCLMPGLLSPLVAPLLSSLMKSPVRHLFRGPLHRLRHSRLQAIALLLLALGAGTAQASTDAFPLRIERAEVSHDGGATWLPVALPDNWALRNAVRQSAGAYRLSFALAAVPAEPLALEFSRLGTHRRVLVNDQLLLQQGDGAGFYNRRGTSPALLELPPALLRAGVNTLRIDLKHIGNGGMPVVVLGPVDELRLGHAQDQWLDVALPQALNLASLGLALFMLTVWLRRRTEVAMGCFGALALLAALRNLAYFSTVVVGPQGTLDWFFYSSQVFTAVLLGLFVQAMAGTWRAYTRLLWVLAACLPLIAAVAAWQDYASGSGAAGAAGLDSGTWRMAMLRKWSYPVLMLAVLPALARMFRVVRGQPPGSLAALAIGVLALVLAGVHDYGVQLGLVDVNGRYLLPYVFPLALGAMSVHLIGRMVKATGAAESLAARLDERVALRTRELAAANAAKARFLGAASHDLRQPVLTIGLLVSLLRDQVAGSPPAAALVDKLRAAAAALESLLHGLMDLSRLDTLQGQPRLQSVALQDVFKDIGDQEQASAEERGLTLRFHPTTQRVDTDQVLLGQILRNLVGNALRYTERGGVLVGARPAGPGLLRLQVWDTGVGIEPAQQQRVFEEFVQLHNPGRNRRQGQGLGLAIVRRCAQALGTTVTLRSVPGRGSCFGVVLPVAGEPGAVQDHPAAGTTGSLTGLRVWLVEDDEELCDALALRLGAWGAEVEAMGSVAEANRRLALLGQQAGNGAQAPQVLVSDQRLGDGLGTEVIERARARLGASLPCLLMSGDNDALASTPVAAAGVTVLIKPFGMDVFRQAIGAALRSPDRRSDSGAAGPNPAESS